MPRYACYERETRGAPPFDVAMMVTLLFYSHSVGVFSSRKIAAACERKIAFLAIVGNQSPDFRTISGFRKNHLQPRDDLFVDVLALAGELGMVKLGNLALDGSKFRAKASRHKAMSYGYIGKEVQRLPAEIDALLNQAEQTDAEQDAAGGNKPQPNEKPAGKSPEVANRNRSAKLPQDKAQTNFTDPDAKIMKSSNKGFDYCFNAQVVVDEGFQIIVGADLTPAANDKQQATPLAEATLANLEAAEIETPRQDDGTEAKIPLSADTGYFSEDNVHHLETQGFDPYIAVGRQKHNQSQPPEADSPPAEATPWTCAAPWPVKSPGSTNGNPPVQSEPQ